MPSVFSLPATVSPLALPPALQTQFKGVVDLLIVETVFPTLLVPIAIYLFMFTKPEVQRKPVFVLNVLSIVLGLVYGGIAVATISRSVAGFHVNSQFITVLTGLYFFIPVCVQCILFVRIIAVYPPRIISWLLALAIYGTLLIMTIARVINLAIALKKISDAARLALTPWAVTGVGQHIPSVTAEMAMSLVYDTIASSLFLFRLRQGGALKVLKRSWSDSDISSSGGRMSYPARLRALFWTALTNFVVPVIFNILLLILVRNEHPSDTITVMAVISVNVYVQIISGLLATLWCHAGTSRDTTASPKETAVTESISTLKFATPSTLTSRIQVEVGAVSMSVGEDERV